MKFLIAFSVFLLFKIFEVPSLAADSIDTPKLSELSNSMNFPRRSVEVKSGPDDPKLRADIQARIGRHWFPPKLNYAVSITIKFQFDATGQVVASKVTESSRSAVADQAALKAVEKASPFIGSPDSHSSDVIVHFFIR